MMERKEPVFDEPSTGTATPGQRGMSHGLDAEHVERVISHLTGNSQQGVSDIAGLRYDTIRQVVDLARRLALESYMQHVNHVLNADGEEERKAAYAALVEAEHAARMADKASQQLVESEAHLRGASLFLVNGDAAGAARSYEASAVKAVEVASQLDAFSAAAPRSRFFTSAVRVVASADGLLGRVEKHIDHVGASLSSFAGRVRSFARVVGAAPRIAEQVAKDRSIALTTASLHVGRTLLSSARDWVSNRVAAAQDGAVKAKAEAWAVLTSVRSKVENAAAVVADHSHALAGLAGTLMGATADAYRAGLAQAQERRRSA